MENRETFWKDRKRLWCGLPWTFTVYQLDEEKLWNTKQKTPAVPRTPVG